MIPSEPRDPVKRRGRSYPLTFFTTWPPPRITRPSPVAATTSSMRSRVGTEAKPAPPRRRSRHHPTHGRDTGIFGQHCGLPALPKTGLECGQLHPGPDDDCEVVGPPVDPAECPGADEHVWAPGFADLMSAATPGEHRQSILRGEVEDRGGVLRSGRGEAELGGRCARHLGGKPSEQPSHGAFQRGHTQVPSGIGLPAVPPQWVARAIRCPPPVEPTPDRGANPMVCARSRNTVIPPAASPRG